MRLTTFRNNAASEAGLYRVGALWNDDSAILDFFKAFALEEVDSYSLLPWFNLDGNLLPRALEFYARCLENPAEAEKFLIAQKEIELSAPVPRPGKLICIGLNYRDHAIESNMEIPKIPIVFSKYPTSVVGDNQPVILPNGSKQADYEAELAVIIGRYAKNISPENALDYVLGYANLNDVSERGFQFADGQWQRGKSCDTFAPIGKFIATKDEIVDPHNLNIAFRLNNETLQQSNTNQLIFDIPAIVSFLSETVTLEPGDVIATGTPPGVGFARKPPVYLKSGDIMEVEIEGLGILRNPVG
ncbi:MAG: fumarylacetoacetate hydrolase family protein [Pyrinomonadaceae bacterium]